MAHYSDKLFLISKCGRCQMINNIEDSKNSAEERASAVRKAEEGASDLRKSVEKLSKNLEDYEKEYQVTNWLCVDCTITLPFLQHLSIID